MTDVSLLHEGIDGLFYVNVLVAIYVVVRAYVALHRDSNQYDSRPYVVPLFMCAAFVVLSLMSRRAVVGLSDAVALGLFFGWQLFHCVMLVAVSVLVHGIERKNNERYSECSTERPACRCLGLDCDGISGLLYRCCCLRCRREIGGRRKQDNPDDQG